MRILVLDNYDSFTYNLVHYIEGFDVHVDVILNDEIELEAVSSYDKIVLSPGPGLPHEAGEMVAVIEQFVQTKPILGVCLGFQGLVEYFGGSLYNQPLVKHGVAERANFDQNSRLFKELPKTFNIGLYHSWAVERHNFPDALKIVATSEENVIMAFEHKKLPVAGVQFHPESVLSDHGRQIIKNFLFNF